MMMMMMNRKEMKEEKIAYLSSKSSEGVRIDVQAGVSLDQVKYLPVVRFGCS